MKLLIATSNPGKLGEIREMLASLGAGSTAAGNQLELVSLADLELPAPDETGATFAENAAQKASASARASGLWALGDDSGLCVDALDGGPGLYSARYAPTDGERRAKLLAALSGVPEGKRGAHFFCAVALCAPDGSRLFRADGRVDGAIARAARGTNGFGYDPLFEPAEVPGRTLAEVGSAEKNRLSHRGRALQALAPRLAALLRDGDLPAR